MPEDLSQADRLRLARRRASHRLWQLMALLFGGITFLLGMTTLTETIAYITNGVTTTAIVTGWRTEKSISRYGDKTNYLIEYQFWTEDASRSISAWQSVAADVWNQTKTSHQIQVVYARLLPSMNKPMVQFTLGSTLVQLVLFLGGGLMLGLAGWRGLATPLTDEHLLKEIASAEAERDKKQALGLNTNFPEPRDNFADSAIYEVRVYGSDYIRKYEFDDSHKHDS
ncbi:MAG TPA: hypothetical protein VLG46_00755 [Anaerolineae bacterium]|nr:hypothetical protein [Anaerolineae bacterium]